MKKFIIILTSLSLLSACTNERPIEEGLEVIPDVEESVVNNEAVSKKNMKIMQEVYDYYFNSSFTEKEKEPYVKYISLKADLEIYNDHIAEDDQIAADFTKGRILKKIEEIKNE